MLSGKVVVSVVVVVVVVVTVVVVVLVLMIGVVCENYPAGSFGSPSHLS